MNGQTSQTIQLLSVQNVNAMTLRSSGKRGLMTEQQTRDQGRGLGAIINEQQDIILSLQRENKRLKRENWNLKRTNWRIRNDKALLDSVKKMEAVLSKGE